LCIVEVVERGRGKTVVSCIYPVEREIEVYTQNESIKEQRGVILTLLHHLAPEAEVITKMAAYLGVALPRLSDKPDGGKCVLCGRCTTACELMGSGAIAKVSRGVGKRIATPYDQASNECIGCGSCANVCPTGQIEYTQTEDSLSIWGKTFTLAHCSRCGASIGTAESYDYACQKANTSAGAEQPITHERLCEACERQATAALLKDSALRYDYARKC
jgi:NADH dehydrogenase/NADH:ubiquinone oxidoreductase subunit G